jgi:DNA-directed RNA polymerase sigma subunit (sigma70/sigma32)
MEDSAMTEQRTININGTEVAVTDEVYRTYYQMGRRERYLTESDTKHGKVLYSDMDTAEMTGEDMIPDMEAVSVEDVAIKNVMLVQLRKHLDKLNESDRGLIDALFFSNGGDGMTEREYAELSGIPRPTINSRKNRILFKLKKLLENQK